MGVENIKIINLSPWLPQEIQLKNSADSYILWTAKPNPPLDFKSCQESFLPFAWVLFNKNTGVLTAGRDPFGQIPLFYYYVNNTFIFSHNIKNILDYLPQRPGLTEQVVLECFQIKLGASVPPVTTQTYFEHIFRVSPGSILKIKNKTISEDKYFILNPNGPDRILENQEYEERFEFLLKESLKNLVGTDLNSSVGLAQELSGGLDSSSIFLAAHELGLRPNLLTHAGADSSEKCEYQSVLFLIKKYGLENQHEFIDADNFEPISHLKKMAEIFPGAPPYIFFMLANNIHEAAQRKSCTKLLSGFLGDECISSHAGLACFIPDMLARKNYRAIWNDYVLRSKNQTSVLEKTKTLIQILNYSNPLVYKIFNKVFDMKKIIKNSLIKNLEKEKSEQNFPVIPSPFTPSIRHRDYAHLQGVLSHTVNMRVEYSAIAGEYFGLEYVYPFLYRPLVEFCFYLPPEFKRREAQGRYLVRDFYAKRTEGFKPDKLKMTGSIMPGTFDACQQSIKSGEFNGVLNNYKNNFYKKYCEGPQHFHIETILKINALMWAEYLEKWA